MSAVEAADYLKEHAVQRVSGLPNPNNDWGHGFAMLPSLTPTPTPTPLPTATLAPTPAILSLMERYDANGDGIIQRDEVIAAIVDYFAGLITRRDVIMVINLYLLGSG